jgi:hypothetical protein
MAVEHGAEGDARAGDGIADGALSVTDDNHRDKNCQKRATGAET